MKRHAWMLAALSLAVDAAVGGGGLRGEVPLPPPRPRDIGDATVAPGKVPLPPPDPRRLPRHAETGAAPEAACVRLMASPAAVVVRLPPIDGAVGCDLAEPVRLDAIFLDDGSRVPLEPAPVLACLMVEAVVAHAREDLAATARHAGSSLANIATSAGYECRGRNRIAGAKPSEHARGNALDIRALHLKDGRMLGVRASDLPAALAENWRSAACARFTTVLGPGSDGYHEDHVHIDLAERRGGYRLCQWTLQPANGAPDPQAGRLPSR